jgi:hypothetical protein
MPIATEDLIPVLRSIDEIRYYLTTWCRGTRIRVREVSEPVCLVWELTFGRCGTRHGSLCDNLSNMSVSCLRGGLEVACALGFALLGAGVVGVLLFLALFS